MRHAKKQKNVILHLGGKRSIEILSLCPQLMDLGDKSLKRDLTNMCKVFVTFSLKH